MKDLQLTGRVAVVVGGASGIGLALTQGLAAAGADASLDATLAAVSKVFLASEGSSFLNGEILTVDGGFLASGVNQ